MKNKIFNNEKFEEILLILAIIIFTIPKSINIIPILHSCVNAFKIIFSILVIILFVLKKIKLNKMLIIFAFYSLYIVVVTFFNNNNVLIPLKTYSLNIASIVTVYLIVKNKYSKIIINFLSKYFLCLIFLTFVLILIQKLFVINSAQTLLGQDNRIILYVLLELLLLSYDIKSNKKIINVVFILGFLILLMRWSVMSFITIFFVFCLFLFCKKTNKKINFNVILIVFLILSLILIFIDIDGNFSTFTLDIFQKAKSFKYRKYIWDAAISLLKNNPINILFGFGFFDTQEYLRSVYPWASLPMTPNHIHNLPLNVVFFSGVFGLVLYGCFFNEISKSIKQIKNKEKNIFYTAIFIGMLFLLLVDTFEYYQVYYIIWALLYYFSNNIKYKKKR